MNSPASEKHKKLWELLDQVQRVDQDAIHKAFVHHLEYTVGKFKHNTSPADIYQALAYTIRDRLIDRWNETQELQSKNKVKRVYYLSLEFLIGRLLNTTLVNVGIRDMVRDALAVFGYDLNEIEEYEPDAGLGNGGLGRLAACFLDSMTTLDIPCMGCTLRYEYGIFHQSIADGYQKEAPDHWLARGNPWEISRNDLMYPVMFYGNTEQYVTETGATATRWLPGETVMAQPYDVLQPGFNTRTVNNLRLWRARSSDEFNFDYFNHGDYVRAVQDKQVSENISKVLYPNENVIQGRELRLKQEYFLASATLQDAIHTFLLEENDWNRLPDRVFFQLNDTHPAIAVAEMLRILVDEHQVDWNLAWSLVGKCTAYTNHTVMPEALEEWDVELFGRLLPRHLEIIYAINHAFLKSLEGKNLPVEVIRKISIIGEGNPKKVRMANLSIIGTKAVNGVAALHTDLLKKDLFKEFYSLWPQKFQNKTNGITHRRWIVSANPDLTDLISSKIGRDWIMDLDRLRDLERFATDPDFQNDWNKVKRKNKEILGKTIHFECGIAVDPDSIFDVQVKRLHEYKRQLLNILHVIGDYQKLKAHPDMPYTPRTVIFAGKAAPGYHRAKLIIKLINSVAQVVNHDKSLNGKLRVAFLPNYRVSLAERIFPASDLSEQISTAGTEASGTGNMKFMLNGALTIGTLDGANIEILEEVGKENIFIFGMTVDEVVALGQKGYDPVGIYERDLEIKRILDAIKWDFFNQGTPGLFQELFHILTYGGDRYYLLADYASYRNAQEQVGKEYVDRKNWIKKSILNTARSGKFSSDRTIREYAEQIWDVKQIKQRPPRISAL